MEVPEMDAETFDRQLNEKIDAVWSQIDHRLAELKCRAAYEEYMETVEHDESDESFGFRKWGDESTCMHISLKSITGIEVYIETIYKIYRDVWKVQGKEDLPEMVMAIYHKVIASQLDQCKNYVISKFISICGDDYEKLSEEDDFAPSSYFNSEDEFLIANKTEWWKWSFVRCADCLREEWFTKCKIEALELEYRGLQLSKMSVINAVHPADCMNLVDQDIEIVYKETQESHQFHPKQFGGKETCIVVSYAKDGQSDIARLSRILADKAHIRYKRKQTYDTPKSWCKGDITGFTNHIHKLRKKAADKGWTDSIPKDYWKSYSS